MDNALIAKRSQELAVFFNGFGRGCLFLGLKAHVIVRFISSRKAPLFLKMNYEDYLWIRERTTPRSNLEIFRPNQTKEMNRGN
jgi:hypothetical protein